LPYRLPSIIPLFLLLALTGLQPVRAQPDSVDSAMVGSSEEPSERAIFNGGGGYLWPTNASRYASSSFGETRSAHFHAALDIKTWGRKGYKVFATRDGVLARVGVWAKGYGNVVYLRHPDGTYSVYAHLEDFVPRIRELVDSLRLRDYSFELNHVVKNKTIRFERGDVIGYSGASGVGPPHLHFELRTARNHPFNPLLTNLSIPDNRAPRFDGLAIEPLGPGSLVEGSKQIHTVPPRFNESGHYDFGTVKAQGKVGLAVNVFDLADRVSNAYAVYELNLEHEGDTLFHSRIDSFSYRQSRQLFIDRIYPLLKSTRQGYQRLYLADGNTLPFYRHKKAIDGKLDLPSGSHDLTITAEDFYGNKRVANLRLDVQPVHADTLQNSLEHFRASNDANHPPLSPEELNRWIWNENWIAYPTDRSTPTYQRYLSDTTWNPLENTFSMKVGSYRVISVDESQSIVDPSSGRGITLHRVEPGRAQHIRAANVAHGVAFHAISLFDTLSVGLIAQHTPDFPQPTLHLYPKNQPLQSAVKIYGGLHHPPSEISRVKWAYYLLPADGDDPEYQSTDYEQNEGRYSAEVEELGVYTLLPDTTRPTITDPRMHRTSDGKWQLSVKVDDNLSGVDYKKASIFLNDQRGIPRFDPEHDRLIYYHPDFDLQSRNTLRVEIPDMVGNQRKATFMLSR